MSLASLWIRTHTGYTRADHIVDITVRSSSVGGPTWTVVLHLPVSTGPAEERGLEPRVFARVPDEPRAHRIAAALAETLAERGRGVDLRTALITCSTDAVKRHDSIKNYQRETAAADEGDTPE